MNRKTAEQIYNKMIAARKEGKVNAHCDTYILDLAEKWKLGPFARTQSVEVNTPAQYVRTHQGVKYKPVQFTAW
jgi:hypothetical protein